MRHMRLWLVSLLLEAWVFLPRENALARTGSWATIPGVPGRVDASMMYDQGADRLVQFGGWDGHQKFNDTWVLYLGSSYNTWTKLLFSPSLQLPTTRSGQTVIYDPIGRRLILFGGTNVSNTKLNDVWALPLWTWDGQQWQPYYGNWQQLTTTGASVPPMTEHSAVLDSQRNRMLVYGGETASGLSAAFYALDLGTLTWSQIIIQNAGVQGPFALHQHVAIYDPADDAMFVFGGEQNHNGITTLSSAALWRVRLSDQTLNWDAFLNPSQFGPQSCINPGGIYDAARQEVVIYGGSAAPNAPSGSSAYRTPGGFAQGWASISPGVAPHRDSFAYAYDSQRSRLMIFGGSEGVPSAQVGLMASNETWSLTLNNTPVWATTHERPCGGTFFSDASMVYDDQHQRTIMFGGLTNSGSVDSVWALNLSGYVDQWAVPNVTGTHPSRRYDHSAIYDRIGDRMIVYGGTDGSTNNSDLWALNRTGGQDLSSNNYQWSQLPNIGGPGPLSGHSAVYAEIPGSNRKMIIFGGRVAPNGTLKSETWSYDLVTNTWLQLPNNGQAPSPRADHGAVYDYPNGRMFIFGGTTSTNFPPQLSNEVYYFNLSTNTWAKGQFTQARPVARANMAVVLSPYSDANMIVYGGVDASGNLLNDIWCVKVWDIPFGTSWSQITTPSAAAPGERQGAAAAYNGFGVVTISGGRWLDAYVGPPYKLETFNDTWQLQYDTNPFGGSVQVRAKSMNSPEVSLSRMMSIQIASTSVHGISVHLDAAGDPGPFDLAVYDVAGRLRRRLDVSPLLKETTVTWDFKDEQGSRVPAGIYFVKLKGHDATASCRIVALH